MWGHRSRQTYLECITTSLERRRGPSSRGLVKKGVGGGIIRTIERLTLTFRAPSTLHCAWRDAKVRWGDPPTRDSTAAQGEADNATTSTPRCPSPRPNFTICTRRQVAYLCKSRGSEPRGSAELRCRLELYTKHVRTDGAERLYTFEG